MKSIAERLRTQMIEFEFNYSDFVDVFAKRFQLYSDYQDVLKEYVKTYYFDTDKPFDISMRVLLRLHETTLMVSNSEEQYIEQLTLRVEGLDLNDKCRNSLLKFLKTKKTKKLINIF